MLLAPHATVCKSRNNGSASVKLDSKVLTKGVNYVVFVCFNKKYDGKGIFAGGKWSYSFRLKKNGDTVWEKADTKKENVPEIVYWKAFVVTAADSGKVDITDKIPKKELGLLKEYVGKLEDKHVESADVAVPF